MEGWALKALLVARGDPEWSVLRQEKTLSVGGQQHMLRGHQQHEESLAHQCGERRKVE